jgi:hypothetical protein
MPQFLSPVTPRHNFLIIPVRIALEKADILNGKRLRALSPVQMDPPKEGSLSITIQSLQADIDSLTARVRVMCERYTHKERPHAPPEVQIRPPAEAPPPGKPRRKSARKDPQVPSIRTHMEDAVFVPVHSNYTEWPARRNASHRIFRPHRLGYDFYRNDRRVAPVLYGAPLDPWSP